MEKEFGIQGRVLVKAKIEEDGTVSDISIVRSISLSLDNEARRVVSSMPKWTPAIASDGKPIRFFIEIPVVFKCVPDPHISLSFSPFKLNVDKYGEYGTSAFEEGCVVFDAVVDKNGKVSKLKINKSQTTIKNSTILLHVQNKKIWFPIQYLSNKAQIIRARLQSPCNTYCRTFRSSWIQFIWKPVFNSLRQKFAGFLFIFCYTLPGIITLSQR